MSVTRSALARRAARAAASQRGVGAEFAGDLAGQRFQAFDALQHRADLVVIDDVGQLVEARGQRRLAVLVEEEAGVGQARTHDAGVAADDVLRIVDLHVGDDQELVEQLLRARRAAGSTSGSAASSGSGIPAARRGTRIRTRRRRPPAIRPAR
jgi:hypothetical protein